MKYASEMERAEFVLALGMMEDEEPVEIEIYMGIVDDFHEFRDDMKRLIKRHRKEADEIRKKMKTETDELVRIDYENLIKTAERYAETNEQRLGTVEAYKDRAILLKRADGLPAYMIVSPQEMALHEKERKNFLVRTYA